MLAELGGKCDFCSPLADTDVKIVLAAVAVTAKWMNMHPEFAAASCIDSGVALESDDRSQGKGELFEKACAVMRDLSAPK